MASVHPVSNRINAERLVVLGWSRAILMQLSHPLLAAGVAEHSAFRDGPVTAVRRLRSTIRAMLSLTFGSAPEAQQTVERIRAIHRRVNGRLRERVGQHAAGTRYSAEDPDLVLWVHATMLDSVTLAYETFVEPLPSDARDALCLEAAWLPVALGAREADVPKNASALAACLERTNASGVLAVGKDARELAGALLRPAGLDVARPLTGLNRLFTIGTLPAHLRELYGFEWTARRAARLARATRFVGRIRPAVPRALALWPEARRH